MRARAFALALVLLAVPALAGCTDKDDTPPADTPPATGPNRAPTALIKTSPETGGADTTFTFDATSSTDPDGDALAFAWTIGAAKKTGEKVTHRFGFTDATVPVTLLVTDARGLSATATKQVRLGTGKNTPPVAALAASPLWVKPAEPVTFDASASTDAETDALTYAFGYGALANPPKVDSGLFGTDKTWSFTYVEQGTYRLHCHPHPTMRHNVTVSSDAPAASTVAVTIKDFRYTPEDILVRPNTKVVYTNKDPVEHTVTLLGFEPKLTPVKATGATGTVAFPSAGLYGLVVAVTDGKGPPTTAQVKVLVDANRPSDVYENTWTGALNATGFGLPIDSTGRHAFKIDHPANGTLALEFESQVPDTELTLTLQRSDGGPGSFTASGTSPVTLAVDVPAGTWTVVVAGDKTVAVTYTLTAALKLTLTPPAEGGDGHDHQH